MANPFITQANQMQTQNLIDPESQALQRQKQYAAALLQQGQQPQGQMVSGHYVAPSFTQQLNSSLTPLIGAYMLNQADTKQAQLAEALRQQGDKDLMAYGEAIARRDGVEAKPEVIPQGQTMLDDQGMPTMGYQAPVQAVPEKKADYALGMSILRGSKDPENRQLAKMLMADQMKTIVAPEGSTIYRGGLFGNGETITSGPKKTTEQKEYEFAKEQGYKGSFMDYQVDIKKAGATNVNIPNFAEKTFAGNLAENQSKKFDTLQTSAEKAPDVLRSVAESKKILDSGKFFSGSPANLQLEMAKYADAVGLGGKDTKEKAFNTQTLITNAAGTTLDSISGSGLGAGQGFTDKDLKFLQEAKSFRIDMTDANIRRVVDLQDRAARASVNKYNERLRSLPQSSIQQMGLREIVLPRTADEIIGN